MIVSNVAVRGLPYKSILTFILILACCFSIGCPPPSRSIVIEEVEVPYEINSYTLDDHYYHAREIYTKEQLKDRLSDKEISKIKLLMSDDNDVTGNRVEIRDSTAYLYTDEWLEYEAHMARINAFVLYRNKTGAEKRDAFLSPVIIFATGGAVGFMQTGVAINILYGALIGAGVGIPTLFDKHEETEVIFNLLYKQKMDLMYNPFSSSRN